MAACTHLRRWLTGLLAGLALSAAPFAAAQDIVIGQIGPYSDPAGQAQANELNEGALAAIARTNAAGGIGGQRLTLFKLDDQRDPNVFVQRFAEAMERRPVALLSPLGAFGIARMLQDKLLDKADVVVLNPIPGAESFRKPGHERLFHIRSGDAQQIERIVEHSRTLGINRLTVLYEKGLPSAAFGYTTAKALADRMGNFTVEGVEGTSEAADLARASAQISRSGTPGVVLFGTPRVTIPAIGQLRRAGVGQSIFALSYMPAPLLAKTIGDEAARGIGIAQSFPNPNGVSLPLQREFQAAMKQQFPQKAGPYTAFQLEGYITVRVLVEGLRRSKPISPAALAQALRSAGEMDFGGYRVNFSKGNVGNSYVDISVVTSGGKLLY